MYSMGSKPSENNICWSNSACHIHDEHLMTSPTLGKLLHAFVLVLIFTVSQFAGASVHSIQWKGLQRTALWLPWWLCWISRVCWFAIMTDAFLFLEIYTCNCRLDVKNALIFSPTAGLVSWYKHFFRPCYKQNFSILSSPLP